MPSEIDELPLSKIDADKEAINHGLHTLMNSLKIVSVRLEKYVEFAIAVRSWAANTTTEGRAAAQVLDLLKKVDEE